MNISKILTKLIHTSNTSISIIKTPIKPKKIKNKQK